MKHSKFVIMISRRGFCALVLACTVNLSFSMLPKTPLSSVLSPHLSWNQLMGKVPPNKDDVPCTCGVFLESQTESKGAALKEGEQPNSIFSYPIGTLLEEAIPGGIVGKRMCTKKCIEEALKLMKTGPQILCSFLDKDITNERIHLFIKNQDDQWYATRLNSGRTFTCKGGEIAA